MAPPTLSCPARLAAAALVAASIAAPAAAQTIVAGADQRSALALTVYEGGFALVSERRQTTLPAGAVTLVLPDLSERLDVATIRLAAGDDSKITSLAFEGEALSQAALLRRALGHTVRVGRVNPATGEETFEDAQVLAVSPSLVLRIGDRIETTVPGRIIFDSVPDDLRATPAIVAHLISAAAGKRTAALSYLSDAIGWRTSYVGRLSSSEDRLELTAWAQVDNQTNTEFPAAQLFLVSGAVNRVTARPVPPRPVLARTMQAEAVADAVPAAASGPYYRYTLPGTFDIRAHQQTQVELLRSAAVPVVRTLRSEGTPLFGVQRTATPQPVAARLSFANSKDAGLGVPLPPGLFSVYAEADGHDVFQGGATVKATPVGGKVEVDLGQAFDVQVERTVLKFDRSGARNENIDTTQKLTVTNGGERPARVELIETFHGEWRMVRESDKHTQPSAFQAMWLVTVPARGAASIEYTAHIGPR